MKRVEIEIDGKKYPCTPTMGAMLQFKKETGRDVTKMAEDIADLCVYLYCCVCSACRREGVKFDMALMDFADAITPADMQEWNRQLSDGDAPVNASEEKKKA